MHDVFFFSYDETYADENWNRLKKICPHAQRIHGIKGTANAWKAAAQQTQSTHFFSVDADNVVNSTFDWSQEVVKPSEENKIHIWRCRNKVNGLVYGHGAIKLWNKNKVLESTLDKAIDFSCESAKFGFVIQPELASETVFNHTAYITFKAAFRECAKLASESSLYFGTQADPKTKNRLKVWMSLGADADYGQECLMGARMGAFYGIENKGNLNALLEINNSVLLNSFYEKRNEQSFIDQIYKNLTLKGFEFQNFSKEQSLFLKSIFYQI